MQSILLEILHMFFGTLVGGNKPFESNIKQTGGPPKGKSCLTMSIHAILKKGRWIDGRRGIG